MSRDEDDQTKIYDNDYWTTQDSDWYGRVSETLRLVLVANELLGRPAEELDILDFGCGMGGFLDVGRRSLGLNVWGTDIIKPKVGAEHFLNNLEGRKFDVITCCEVIEHFPQPRETFDFMRRHLKSPGVIAFQTCVWEPALGREFWYLGPHNGHISIYSRRALDIMFEEMGGKQRRIFRNYAGLQAWLFSDPRTFSSASSAAFKKIKSFIRKSISADYHNRHMISS